MTHQEADERRLELVQKRASTGESADAAPIRVVIADDHQLTRVGLITTLSAEPRLRVVGEAGNGREAVRLVETLEPDLLVLDVRMPEMDGLEATRRVKQLSPMTSVLLLSMFDDPDLLLEAIKAGAAGYVLKDTSLEELRTAIFEVLSGGFPVDARMARVALQRLANEDTPAPAAGPQLSSRELEVLRLLAQGATNREIAEALTITLHTVKGHVEHILAKLGVSDRTQAAVRGIQLGLVTPGQQA